MSIQLTIHGTGTGTCSLTGKEAADGLTVTFEDGTVKEGFLSWKAFQQLLRMKVGHNKSQPLGEMLGMTPPGTRTVSSPHVQTESRPQQQSESKGTAAVGNGPTTK